MFQCIITGISIAILGLQFCCTLMSWTFSSRFKPIERGELKWQQIIEPYKIDLLRLQFHDKIIEQLNIFHQGTKYSRSLFIMKIKSIFFVLFIQCFQNSRLFKTLWYIVSKNFEFEICREHTLFQMYKKIRCLKQGIKKFIIISNIYFPNAFCGLKLY